MKRYTIIAVFFLFGLLAFHTVKALAVTSSGIPAPQEKAGSEAKSAKLYGIGSVSKVFTAAAVMKLADKGKLDLDTPLRMYIPEFAMADIRYVQITPRMLLNHSSGLQGTTDDNEDLLGDNDTYNHDRFLDFLKTQALKHDPGDRSIYSNDSFTLAEILIERVSGISFTDFIEQNFSAPLGLTNIKSPQSDFDQNRLAAIYLGNSELKPENLNGIGSGGLYATMEDLCKYAAIFMDSADGSVLSKKSVHEMAKIQHKMEVVSPDADTTLRYGFGWDAVKTYPFNTLNIKALSKGGATSAYHTNLTVLPEYNIAAAVASSGRDSQEQLIAQEIILAVLEEEGLIPGGTAITRPKQNLERAKVPENLKSYAGFYDTGVLGNLIRVEMTEDSLILTPIGVRNERPQEFIYNTDGEFVSVNGDYFAVIAGGQSVGVTSFTFARGKYLMGQNYEDFAGLSATAIALPLAEKIETNPVSLTAWKAWTARNNKEYLLVSEKHTSAQYLKAPISKILADDRIPGYVSKGIYKSDGTVFPSVKIVDENSARGYQNIPTMVGRDIKNLSVSTRNGVEVLSINNDRYMDAAAARKYSELGEKVAIGTEAIWVNVDSDRSGKIISIETPSNGSWFAYDDKMNCIASSLEKNFRETIILPENGRLAFVGEPGAEFVLSP